MAGKRNPGVLDLLVEAQRRRQREQQAQQRAWEAAHAEQQKAHRAAQRAAARGHKALLEAYQRDRDADAARQTAELEQRIMSLGRILIDGVALPPLQPAYLKTTAPEVPFQPGVLAQPIPMPDPARYQVPSLPALQALHPTARRAHADQVAHARGRFQHDWQAAQAAEADRLRRLDEAQRQHQAWLYAQQRQAAEYNVRVDALPGRLQAGVREAVEEYFTAAMYVAAGWPAPFPRQVGIEWDSADRQLIIDWQLPGFEIVPDADRIRYVKTSDEHKRIAMPAGRRAALYRDAICQSALRVVSDLLRADHYGCVTSVVFNGYVMARDPATGQDTERCLISATVRREDLGGVHLAEVDAAACLRQLRAQVSARPERLEPVRPGRRARGSAEPRGAAVDDQDDLYQMDPGRFEELVAELFRVRGLEVTKTGRSGDGGVDVEARDPDPITGGLIVIQAKRYRATVSPSVVRDLYGTVQHRGAIKGVLVVTSGFGPGSQEFAHGKPLTLINGTELANLLAHHGLQGRLGTLDHQKP
ncbi:restriction endonuclease [Actinoplanes flavus]|uniref:Restriction endonuclease n=1 Tax=Actinoplanes flavus TaxID=2820290 RepID=A0ABS3UJ26_9ACTN|nr:restriction endonuclease [Actinoplanes flavus]MBO3738787.1 restriction endonuclease [Actinoplanes flavus]